MDQRRIASLWISAGFVDTECLERVDECDLAPAGSSCGLSVLLRPSVLPPEAADLSCDKWVIAQGCSCMSDRIGARQGEYGVR